MNTAKIVKILTSLNLSIACILLLDNFVLPAKQVNEVYDQASYTYGAKGKIESYYVHALSGRKYKVPYGKGILLDKNSGFVIERSAILQMPVKIIFQSEGKYYSSSISILTSNLIFVVLLALAVGFSIFCIVSKPDPSRVIGRLSVTSVMFYATSIVYFFL